MKKQSNVIEHPAIFAACLTEGRLSSAAREIFSQISVYRPLYVSETRCELATVRGPRYLLTGQCLKFARPVSREIAQQLIGSGLLHRLTRDGEPPNWKELKPGQGYRAGYADLEIPGADEGAIYVHLQ